MNVQNLKVGQEFVSNINVFTIVKINALTESEVYFEDHVGASFHLPKSVFGLRYTLISL